LRRGDLVEEMERAILALDEGAVCGEPVRTRYGWHVVRLDRRAPPQQLSFEAVKETIRDALRARAALASSARYVARLAAAADIEGVSLSGEADG
jgi:peptidyl-prolyl cis-trans isomerase C